MRPETKDSARASPAPAGGAGVPARQDDAGPPDGPDDEALLKAMTAGDSAAFDRLFARHSASVFSFLSRLTGSQSDSEDLLQETFLRILTHAKEFRPGAAFRPWLFTIARNVAYTALQKRKVRGEVEVRADSDSLPPPAAGSDGDPSARMQTQERKAKLLAALEELPAPQREIIVLVVFDGFSYEEAAAVTGDSESTLRSRVFHALRKLRERLKEPI